MALRPDLMRLHTGENTTVMYVPHPSFDFEECAACKEGWADQAMDGVEWRGAGKHIAVRVLRLWSPGRRWEVGVWLPVCLAGDLTREDCEELRCMAVEDVWGKAAAKVPRICPGEIVVKLSPWGNSY